MYNINCRKCQYFYVTWDKYSPYGCKFFGFKSYQIPSQVVKHSSSNDCKAFKIKR